MEKENIQTMLNGKDNRPPMVEAERVNEVVTAIAESQQRILNTKQRSAIEQILCSRDQIIGLQGGAGTGKTTALSVLREAAEKEGYQVRGFAPSERTVANSYRPNEDIIRYNSASETFQVKAGATPE